MALPKTTQQRIASLIALNNIIRETSAAFREAEQRIVKEDSEVQAGGSRALSVATSGRRFRLHTLLILAFSSLAIAKVLAVLPQQRLPAERATTDPLVASGQGLDA
jgi:hypothetical protein